MKPQKSQVKSKSKPVKPLKSQQKIINLQKSEQKKQKQTIVFQQKLIKSRDLIKPLQQPSFERMECLRKKLNEFKSNFSRSEYNVIRKNLYDLKNKKPLLKESIKYFNDLKKNNY